MTSGNDGNACLEWLESISGSEPFDWARKIGWVRRIGGVIEHAAVHGREAGTARAGWAAYSAPGDSASWRRKASTKVSVLRGAAGLRLPLNTL